MRIVLAVCVLLSSSFLRAHADTPSYHAGFTRVTVQDVVSFDALVAYPSDVAEVPARAGPFTIDATRDAPVAAGAPFPIVLFSHGNGRSGGSPLVHRELIVALARQGFIVIAPFHPGTSRPIEDRPRQIHRALDRVLGDQRFSTRADRAQMTMIGYSFGGAVALAVAGAIPNFAHLSAYCRDRTDDPRACDGVPKASSSPPVAAASPDILPLKAIVLLEPFGALFDSQGLKSINIPVLLYRAEHSDLAADGNIFALVAGLPRPPQQKSAPGGHFVFIDPCPPQLTEEAPSICKDAAGVDRVAIHQRLEIEVASFLRKNE